MKKKAKLKKKIKKVVPEISAKELLPELFNEQNEDPDLEYRKFLNENLLIVIREVIAERGEEIKKRATTRITMLREMWLKEQKPNKSGLIFK